MDAKMARAGAKWWADVLRRGAKLDNGDPSPTGAMTYMMAKMLQSSTRERQDEGQYQQFEVELANLLEPMEGQWLSIGVDYQPDRTLIEAADRAGLVYEGTATFPWKTNMSFRDGAIHVSYGYRAPTEQIYPG